MKATATLSRMRADDVSAFPSSRTLSNNRCLAMKSQCAVTADLHICVANSSVHFKCRLSIVRLIVICIFGHLHDVCRARRSQNETIVIVWCPILS